MKLFLRNFFSLAALYALVNVLIYYTLMIHPVPEESLKIMIKAQTIAGIFVSVCMSAMLTSNGRKFI